MTFIAIERVGSLGVTYSDDAAIHQIPPEAWTVASNVRFIDGRAQRIDGYARVMEPPTVAPAFVMSVDNAGDVYWLYASAIGAGSKVYVYNSGAHSDISKAGNYAAPNFRSWNGTVFQGVPILNCGVGAPQYWGAFNPSTDLADVVGWPANTVAKVIREFGNYLVALNITNSADGATPHRVLWSDGADPGTLPASWDVTDPAYEAGNYDLSDVNSGQILDGYMLQDNFAIYKDESTWIMRYVGGQNIMGFKRVLGTSGILAVRCVVPIRPAKSTGEFHFIKTGDDLGVFDGQSFTSIISKKVRRWLNANIDARYYANSFVCHNPYLQEAYFCFPENGYEYPTMALVWNYATNTCTFRAWTGVSAASGSVESASSATWTSVAGAWSAQDPALWQESSRRKFVVADPVNIHLYQMETGLTFDSTVFSATLERKELAIIGRDSADAPIVDYNSRKLLSRVWPKVTGGAVNVQIGGADMPGEEPTFGPVFEFDPASGVRYVDCGWEAADGAVVPVNAVFLAIRFSSTTSIPWKLEGYGLDVEVMSEL